MEAAAMQLVQALVPSHVPHVLLHDPEASVMAVDFLAPPHAKVRVEERGARGSEGGAPLCLSLACLHAYE